MVEQSLPASPAVQGPFAPAALDLREEEPASAPGHTNQEVQ